MTEEEYATLVAKRRKENANFVVGAEENDEYVDMGEEEDWTRENPAYRDEEDDTDGGNGTGGMDAEENEGGGNGTANAKSKKELAKEKKRKQLEKEKLKASKGIGLVGSKMDIKK